MTRTKRGNVSKKRHKKKLKKGFRGSSSILFKNANQQFLKSFKNSFIDRRQCKRSFRSVWISRINAKVRQFGYNYNSFIFNKKNSINRKICSQLFLYDKNLIF